MCFWGYKNNLNDIEEFTYIKRVSSFKEFLKLEDDLLNAYIYYVLSFVFGTTRETELQQNALNQMKQLLSLRNIFPTMPIVFNNQK